MTITIFYRLSRSAICAPLPVRGGPLSASGRLRVHRRNARFFYQPRMSHRSSVGPAEFQLIPRCTPLPKHEYFLRPYPAINPPNQFPIAQRPHHAERLRSTCFFARSPGALSLALVFVAAEPRKETSAFHATNRGLTWGHIPKHAAHSNDSGGDYRAHLFGNREQDPMVILRTFRENITYNTLPYNNLN